MSADVLCVGYAACDLAMFVDRFPNENTKAETALAGCRHLLRAAVWFSESMLCEGNKLLFQAARQANVAVSPDLNWDPHWGSAHTDEDPFTRRLTAIRWR